MENNTMTLFETIVDELSSKEFTKKDLQQIQGRYHASRREAVTMHRELFEDPSETRMFDAMKFTEEDITCAHQMKHARCSGSGGAYAVWQELYSNEEHCKKIMEKDNAEQRMKRKQFEKQREEENKWKKPFSEEELKLKNEKYQKEKKVKLMKHYGLFDK